MTPVAASTRRSPPLADVLASLLPDSLDTLLLRACLGDGACASAAWKAWLADAGGLSKALTDRPASRALMPLLHYSLRSHRMEVADSALAVLRAAVLWEQRRAAEIHTILCQVMDALRKAGVGAIAIEGVAVGAAVYPAFELRHCHNIALLVEEAALGPAREALTRMGLAVPGEGAASGRGSPVGLLHKGGLPVVMHIAAWASTNPSDPAADLRRHAIAVELNGLALTVLSPTDMFLYTCGQGIGPGEAAHWEWVADAAMILRRHGDTGFDWPALVAAARRHGIAFRLSLRLDYLARRLGLRVPAFVTDELAVAAWKGERHEWERALSVARGGGKGLGAMLRQAGWRSRLAIARWALRRAPRLLDMNTWR